MLTIVIETGDGLNFSFYRLTHETTKTITGRSFDGWCTVEVTIGQDDFYLIDIAKDKAEKMEAKGIELSRSFDETRRRIEASSIYPCKPISVLKVKKYNALLTALWRFQQKLETLNSPQK
jgi:hypothetical protein